MEGGEWAVKDVVITLRQMIVAFLGFSIGVVTSILVMIHGWGLEPKSWGWIIGIYFFGHMMGWIMIKLGTYEANAAGKTDAP